MAKHVQHIRFSTVASDAYKGVTGEVIMDTTKNTLVLEDGVLEGGYPMAREDLANIPGATVTQAGKMTAAHVEQLNQAGINVLKVDVFNSSGVWTKPVGATRVAIICVGGGGAGGGAGASGGLPAAGCGGAGGGGGYSYNFLSAASLLGSEVVTVGAGGAGVNGAAGLDGGTSSFGSPTTHVSARGGQGGQAGIAVGNFVFGQNGNGGAGILGAVQIDGSDGIQAHSFIANSGTLMYISRGSGGASGRGYGGMRTESIATIASLYGVGGGQTGKSYGGGGSGAFSASMTSHSASTPAGGYGANGFVIVQSFG